MLVHIHYEKLDHAEIHRNFKNMAFSTLSDNFTYEESSISSCKMNIIEITHGL